MTQAVKAILLKFSRLFGLSGENGSFHDTIDWHYITLKVIGFNIFDRKVIDGRVVMILKSSMTAIFLKIIVSTVLLLLCSGYIFTQLILETGVFKTLINFDTIYGITGIIGAISLWVHYSKILLLNKIMDDQAAIDSALKQLGIDIHYPYFSLMTIAAELIILFGFLANDLYLISAHQDCFLIISKCFCCNFGILAIYVIAYIITGVISLNIYKLYTINELLKLELDDTFSDDDDLGDNPHNYSIRQPRLCIRIITDIHFMVYQSTNVSLDIGSFPLFILFHLTFYTNAVLMYNTVKYNIVHLEGICFAACATGIYIVLGVCIDALKRQLEKTLSLLCDCSMSYLDSDITSQINSFLIQSTSQTLNVNLGSVIPLDTSIILLGTKLSVYDISKSAVDPIKDKGARVCSSPAEVAEQSDLLFTMLPNNDIVREAYNGKDGVFNGAKKGTLLVDSSTISPDVARSVGTAASDKGFHFIDAPVSGGVVGARDATLTFMVGGTKADMERAEPYILHMGKRAVHCGNLGAGQVAKICNNMLLAITMIGVSESMNLGIRLGLDPKTLMDIINTSTGRCWSSEVYNPVPNLMENVPSSNNYAGGFAVQLVTKDLGLAQDAATKSHTPIPMGALAHQVYTTLTSKGLGDKDFAVIYDFLKQK